MDKWNQRFLNLAKHVSSWSKDPSTKVGAVIADPETKIVVGMGYNGFPRFVDDTEERYNDRPTKYKFVVHAELNAILNSNKSVRGCEIYIYPTLMKPNCCPECANEYCWTQVDKTREENGEDWEITDWFIHWEGETEVCYNCDKTIESAYGEVE